MEEDKDIKILEGYLKGDKIYDTELDNALRNLIARYKELEERYWKREKRYTNYYNNLKERHEKNLSNLLDDYIPKSKVKEKIEYKKEKLNNLVYSSDRYRRTCLQAEIDFGEELLED